MCCSFRCVGAPLLRFGERVEVLGDRPTQKKSCGFRGCVVECLPKGREVRDLGYHGKVRGSDGTKGYVWCTLRNPQDEAVYRICTPPHQFITPGFATQSDLRFLSQGQKGQKRVGRVVAGERWGPGAPGRGGGGRRERRHEGGSFLRYTGHRPRVEEAAHVLHENGRAPQPDGKPTDRDNRTFRPASR